MSEDEGHKTPAIPDGTSTSRNIKEARIMNIVKYA
jgi:hypothetical protein